LHRVFVAATEEPIVSLVAEKSAVTFKNFGGEWLEDYQVTVFSWE
jgi:hypothetical protein